MVNENKIAVYIIVPNILKEKLLTRLEKNNYNCTLLNTHGAYLRAGQTTVLTITEEDTVDKLRDIVNKTKQLHNDNYFEKVKSILIFSVPVIDFEIV